MCITIIVHSVLHAVSKIGESNMWTMKMKLKLDLLVGTGQKAATTDAAPVVIDQYRFFMTVTEHPSIPFVGS